MTVLYSKEPRPRSFCQDAVLARLPREAAGLDSESVKALLLSQFGLSHPQYLDSRQCDELIALLEGITEPV